MACTIGCIGHVRYFQYKRDEVCTPLCFHCCYRCITKSNPTVHFAYMYKNSGKLLWQNSGSYVNLEYSSWNKIKSKRTTHHNPIHRKFLSRFNPSFVLNFWAQLRPHVRSKGASSREWACLCVVPDTIFSSVINIETRYRIKQDNLFLKNKRIARPYMHQFMLIFKLINYYYINQNFKKKEKIYI